MICKTCKKAVDFQTQAYLKFSSPTDGQLFYHLKCWSQGAEKKVDERTHANTPLLSPYTALGEAL